MLAAQHTRGGPAESGSGVGAGTGFFEAIARAIIREDPPLYSRGAWATISDVPFPGPPPYAGSRYRPPTYEEAMEIGVVASPMRVAQRMRRQSRQAASAAIGRAASAPELAAMSATSSGAGGPQEPSEEMLPPYGVEADTVPASHVVRGWRLGEPALEKPP
ncbi:hypothetical protein IWQ56_003417, partial [Coemansia nantahalensis]